MKILIVDDDSEQKKELLRGIMRHVESAKEPDLIILHSGEKTYSLCVGCRIKGCMERPGSVPCIRKDD